MAIQEIAATLNISNAAELARTVLVTLKDRNGNDYSAAVYAGFHGSLKNETSGETVEMGVGISSEGNNVLELDFPALSAGSWRYEIWATSENAADDRIIVGIYSAVDAIVSHADEAETGYLATLVVGEDNQVISARFTATTAAQLYALQAEAAVTSVGTQIEELKADVDSRISAAVVSATAQSEANAAAAADSAEKAAEQAQLAEESADAAALSESHTSSNVEIINAFAAKWETQVYTLIWIGDDGYWHVGLKGSTFAINTGVKAQGDAGKSPYIGDNKTWWVWDEESGAYVDTGHLAVPEDGHSPYINTLGTWSEWSVEKGGYVDTGVAAHGQDGIDGVAVRRILVDSVEDIPSSGETCNGGFYYYVAKESGGYDVYAWLEPAGWTLIGDAYDVATTEILGLSKLGTDVVCTSGAPVGVNANKQLMVPVADTSVSGSVKVSVSEHPTAASANANVALRSDGTLTTIPGTVNTYGSVRPSRNDAPTESTLNQNISCTASGHLTATPAELDRYGTVRLGSVTTVVNPIPFQQGVAKTPEGKISNNFLYTGALQHRKRASWVATGSALALKLSEEYEPDAAGSLFNGSDWYTGLLTTESLTQTEQDGLGLAAATDTLLGGVMLGFITSGSDKVPTSGMVYQYLADNYYTKSHIDTYYWTAAEIQAWAANTPVTDVWVREQHAIMKQEVADTYLSKADAEETYYTIASASSEFASVRREIANAKTEAIQSVSVSFEAFKTSVNKTLDSKVILRGNSGIAQLSKLTSEEFGKLATLSDDTLYIITA